jgi:hypothetical protein
MAFAQLTYRESLHDIEASLSAQQSRLYHMGFRQPVSRTTLTDTDQRRDFEYTSTDLFDSLLQIFSGTIFEKIELTQAVTSTPPNQNQSMCYKQLNLFDF